jgi:hypothetical protein
MIHINKLATGIETGFNVTNSIPIVAIPGSALRTNVATVQFIAAAIFTLIGFIGQMAQSGSSKWEGIFNYSSDHMIHGALNYIRGLGEFLLATTIVGSLIPLVYQLSVKNGFSPIIKYETSPFTQITDAAASIAK